MKSALLLSLLLPASAFASVQNLTCLGVNQSGTLYLEFGVVKSASVEINDEGKKYRGKLNVRQENRRKGTVTYKQKKGSLSVTIPKIWEDRGFESFTKDDKNGYQITEMTSFNFGKGQSLNISECESMVD